MRTRQQLDLSTFDGQLLDGLDFCRNVYDLFDQVRGGPEYLARRLLHERGGSFGVKGILRDRKTGDIVSKPHVHTGDELKTDLADQIIDRLKSKSNKNYPPGTVLVVNCVPNTLILESEWNDAIEQVTKAQLHLAFREVFLLETVMSHSTTLYGDRKRRRKPK
jgi:hypothetical protein